MVFVSVVTNHFPRYRVKHIFWIIFQKPISLALLPLCVAMYVYTHQCIRLWVHMWIPEENLGGWSSLSTLSETRSFFCFSNVCARLAAMAFRDSVVYIPHLSTHIQFLLGSWAVSIGSSHFCQSAFTHWTISSSFFVSFKIMCLWEAEAGGLLLNQSQPNLSIEF